MSEKAAPNENTDDDTEETMQQKIAEAQNKMHVYAKMHGWKQSKANPGIWTHERKNDKGVDVINYVPTTEYPGTHHLGRVYVSHDNEAIYDNEMFDEPILEYMAKAREEAARAGIKVPLPGKLPDKQKPTPTPQPASQSQSLQQKPISNPTPNIESRKTEQIARAKEMIAETDAKTLAHTPAPTQAPAPAQAPAPENPTTSTGRTKPTPYTAAVSTPLPAVPTVLAPAVLVVVDADKVVVRVLKPGDTVEIPLPRK